MTMKKNIVNIINFIRDVEPREWVKVDLEATVKKQIELMKKHKLRGTFLLQYDALCDPVYTNLMKQLDPYQFELGIWHEIVEGECVDAGIEWKGRYSWDWYAHCGFSVGYTKPQREKLCDVLFEKFYEIFGYYPRVFGSWFFDSHTLNYITDKYGLDAACNCKEQYGTDGYTLWGGYYGQGYYPSRNNCFLPSQTHEHQVDTPIFRMLGSDPVYQYDIGLDINSDHNSRQNVCTLEPADIGFSGGGSSKKWVDWYFTQNFNGECLSFGYAQTGQENSFGWEKMKNGLEYQFAELERLQNEGKLIVEPIGESGRWFKKAYALTPPSVISAHSAYDDKNKRSVWYSSKFYRVNVYSEDNIRIRDIHIFSDKLSDPYDEKVCTSNSAEYEAVPLIDGNRHSGNGILAGAFFENKDCTFMQGSDFKFTELENGCAELDYECAKILLGEKAICISAENGFAIALSFGKKDEHFPILKQCDEKLLELEYRGVKYAVALKKGRFIKELEKPVKIISENGMIEAEFICR